MWPAASGSVDSRLYSLQKPKKWNWDLRSCPVRPHSLPTVRPGDKQGWEKTDISSVVEDTLKTQNLHRGSKSSYCSGIRSRCSPSIHPCLLHCAHPDGPQDEMLQGAACIYVTWSILFKVETARMRPQVKKQFKEIKKPTSAFD